MRMPFGKHVGEAVEDLPSGYITWVLSETDVDRTNPALARELQNQLDMREGMGVNRGRPRS